MAKNNGREKSDRQVIGKRFGRLVVLKRINDEGRSTYLCKCDCGNQTNVIISNLLTGAISSCGCLRRYTATKSMKKIMEIGDEILKMGQVEETSIYSLKQKVSKNSTTKVKGVSKMKNGKYRAYINLRREQKHLGSFDTIEEAQEARMLAEKEMYNPIIDKYTKNQTATIEKDH